MSYDLMVFAAEDVHQSRDNFLTWYEAQIDWEEDHDYDDPAVSDASLRAWFLEITTCFPAMNGPFAPAEDPEDEASLTDYSIGTKVIYAAFAWSKAEEAYSTAKELAAKHGVGFFETSGPTGRVWLPDGRGGLLLAHEDSGKSDKEAGE